MTGERTNVFVSYDHSDASLVAPVVKLLRVNKSLVFQDVDSIRPGKRWRSEIAQGLSDANLVVVFWCRHASRSAEVSREWNAAIEQQKDLLPLLLDATPLPSGLSDFQWIDFRAAVGATHTAIEAPPAPARSRAPVALGMLATLAVVVVAGGVWMTLQSPSELPPPTGSAGPLPAPAPEPEFLDFQLFGGGPMSWLALLLVVAAGVAWLVRGRRKKQPLETAGTGSREVPPALARQLAGEIEVEILRRRG
jgi:hypothetical protein